MSTISAMANNTYMMYKMASGTSTSSTTSTSSSASSGTSSSSSGSSDSTTKSSSLSTAAASVSSLSNLVNAFSSSHSSSTTNSTQDSIKSLWSNYTSSSSSSSLSSLSTLSGIKSNAASLVSSYNESRTTFTTQLSSTMSDLKTSAATVANMNYSFSASDITTNSDGSKTYSDSLKSALKNVKQLVSDYNEALSFSSDYSSVSNRMKALSTTFADTTYRADTYKQLGITVDSSTGKLTLDEDKLASALVENGDRVKNALGSNGLAGKAESHVDLANSQKSSLFPSMQSMFGNSITTAAAYTNPNVLNASVQASLIGNMLDTMF